MVPPSTYLAILLRWTIGTQVPAETIETQSLLLDKPLSLRRRLVVVLVALLERMLRLTNWTSGTPTLLPIEVRRARTPGSSCPSRFPMRVR